jgi:hypothetical protein
MHRIAPYATETYHLTFTILKDAEAIRQTEQDCRTLLGE